MNNNDQKKGTTTRKKEKERTQHPIKKVQPANRKQKAANKKAKSTDKASATAAASVPVSFYSSSELWTWVNQLTASFSAKPRDKRIAALAALNLKSVPESKREVEAAYRWVVIKHHPDKRSPNCTTEQTELHEGAYAAMGVAKDYFIWDLGINK